MKTQTRHDLFIKLVSKLMKMSNAQHKSIAEEVDISPITLYNWCYGETINPHLNTIMRVAEAMGYEIKLEKRQPVMRKVA